MVGSFSSQECRQAVSQKDAHVTVLIAPDKARPATSPLPVTSCHTQIGIRGDYAFFAMKRVVLLGGEIPPPSTFLFLIFPKGSYYALGFLGSGASSGKNSLTSPSFMSSFSSSPD